MHSCLISQRCVRFKELVCVLSVCISVLLTESCACLLRLAPISTPPRVHASACPRLHVPPLPRPLSPLLQERARVKSLLAAQEHVFPQLHSNLMRAMLPLVRAENSKRAGLTTTTATAVRGDGKCAVAEDGAGDDDDDDEM